VYSHLNTILDTISSTIINTKYVSFIDTDVSNIITTKLNTIHATIINAKWDPIGDTEYLAFVHPILYTVT
jgi:hypothetical protein